MPHLSIMIPVRGLLARGLLSKQAPAELVVANNQRGSTMGYAEFIQVSITTDTDSVSVGLASLQWGKFYEPGDMDKELTDDQIDAIMVSADSVGQVFSCGRDDSPSGTEGQFGIFYGGVQLGTFVWDAPYRGSTNTFNWTPIDASKLSVTVQGGSYSGSSIGPVTLAVTAVAAGG
ncbi:MAG: hypothetical protein ACI8RZ_000535 [Myxococcota bacterium]|jgi:hypothetical protein